MKHLGAGILFFLCAPWLTAGDTLKEARTAWLRGNYAEAAETYVELVKKPATRAAASIGLSRAYQSQGEWEKAQEAVDGALKDSPKNADLLARRAELLHLRGQWGAAEKVALTALEQSEDHFLARWVLGITLRDQGNFEKADDAFRWFIRTYSKRSEDDKEITDPDELLLVGLAGLERARMHNIEDQYEFILNEVFKEAVKNDKLFWLAEHETGSLFAEKHNNAAASRAFDRALAINPRAAETLVGKGNAALQRFEIKDAEQFADQALTINPRLPEALRLKADTHLFGGEIAPAMKVLNVARDVNTNEEPTLARVAACLKAVKKEAEFTALVKQVFKNNPKPAVFFNELAENMEQRKFYEDAETYYKQAMEYNPNLPWPQSGLGMLYMRQGREDEARKVLDSAFKFDSFNVRVSNTLKVLDHLNAYDTIKTEHFLLRHDPKHDKVLANFMAKYLEDIYKELADKFDYRPKRPILIEVFNKHEMFSGRVVALPDLHTIGACTGTLVAMVSPQDKSKIIAKPFNWNRVIRHELVHVFNLEQTKQQVPHWFTEGLAVTYEGLGTPPQWNALLEDKMKANELLNLDNILLAFVRPRSPDQWQQAYLQSTLYVDYLTKTHGDKSIGKMLAGFAEGLSTEGALKKAVGVTKEEFEKGYRAFLEEHVKKLAGDRPAKTLTFKALKEAVEKNPEDADLTAQLADRYYSTGDKKRARELADKTLTLKRDHPLGAYVKAMLLNDSGDSDIALSLLESVATEACKEVKTHRLLGRMYFESKKFAEAAKAYERCRALEPHETAWLPQLAKIYSQSGDNDKLLGVLKDLTKLDADDLVTRKKLAKMSADAGKHADAERYALQSLEIDVLDADCQRILLDALTAQNKDAELALMKKLLEQ